MTVRYRSATLGEFIEHHSYDVSRGGMFIKTPSPFPPGTLLKFEVKIAEDQRLMQGVGRVVWKRDGGQAGADAPAGMGVKFIKIDEASHAVIERLIEGRERGGPGAFDQANPSADQPGQRSPSPEQSGTELVSGATASGMTSSVVASGDAASGGVAGSDSTHAAAAGSAAAGSVSAGGHAENENEVRDGSAPIVSAESAPPDVAQSLATATAAPREKRRRGVLIVLLVLLAFAAIYVLTHRSEPPPADSGLDSAE